MTEEPTIQPMENTEESEQRPPLKTYADLASRTSLFLGADALTEEAVYEGCNQARELQLGAVLVRPSDVDMTKNWLAGSAVELHCVTGFPGGASTTPAKLYEARDVLRRGVKELSVAMNLGKLISRKFLYLESELLQLSEICTQNEARLRLLFDVDRLERDHMLIGVRLAKRTRANVVELHFAGTQSAGAHVERLAGIARYVVHHAKGKVGVMANAPAISLAAAQAVHEAGAEGVVTADAAGLLDAWRQELARREEEARKQREAEAEKLRSESSHQEKEAPDARRSSL